MLTGKRLHKALVQFEKDTMPHREVTINWEQRMRDRAEEHLYGASVWRWIAQHATDGWQRTVALREAHDQLGLAKLCRRYYGRNLPC